MNDDHTRGGKFWIGFFIGGILGAVVLFFLGTREGKKTGKSIELKGKDILDELMDRLSDLETKGKNLAKQGEEIKDEVIERIQDKKEELTDGATEKLDNALAQIEELQEKSRETTADLRKRLFKNLPKKN